MIAERQLSDYPLGMFRAEGRRLRMAAYYTVRRSDLVDMRMRRRMTQDKLAKAAGVSKQTITRMESGTNVPQFDTIEKVAAALEVDPAALIVYHTPADEPQREGETLPGGARNAQDLTEGLNAAAKARRQNRSGATDDQEADRGRRA